VPPGPPVRGTETRHVPAGGVSVWGDPDPSAPPITELPAGYELTVVGRRGPWMHIQSGDGLDGWVDGTQLAGVAVGAAPVANPVPPSENRTMAAPPGSVVVEKRPSSFLVATGPVLGAIGGLIAIFGAALPWQQTVALRLEVDAFGIPVQFLSGWDNLAKDGLALGWLIVILAGIGTVVSLISGGGIVRRILGFVIIVICVVYVLQQQDWLTTNQRGLGTGLNVWDIVDYGVVVTGAGGVLMLFSQSR
jgi:Bacterial SH3 domain